MKSYSFFISEKDGIKFSKTSGDYNKIHIDNLTGYNSLYGEKICHGCLVVIRTLKITNILKHIKKLKKYNIDVKFNKNFTYNKKIEVKLKKNKSNIKIKLYQNKVLAGELNIVKLLNFSLNEKNLVNFKYKLKKKITKNNNGKNKIFFLLENLSKYVGLNYPGENSLINSININYQYRLSNNNKNIHIYSKKIDARTPIIDNKLFYENYLIKFETIERPKIYLNFKKINNKILKKIKSINQNILIIGASSGIGYDVLNMLIKNNKVKIIATYFKNKIKLKNKNIHKIKINVEKNLNDLMKIIKANSPINIYYFATPKIFFDIRTIYLDRLYENYFVKFPLSIIKNNNNFNNNFFYPSTTYNNKKSSYSLMKLKGEKEIKKYNKSKIKINILKIDLINTKQNLSVLNYKTPNFRDFLEKNKNYQKKFFFN